MAEADGDVGVVDGLVPTLEFRERLAPEEEGALVPRMELHGGRAQLARLLVSAVVVVEGGAEEPAVRLVALGLFAKRGGVLDVALRRDGGGDGVSSAASLGGEKRTG